MQELEELKKKIEILIEEAYMMGLKEGMRTIWEEGLKGVTE